MALKGKEAAKSGKGKAKDTTGEKSDKPAGKLKPATSINVRHILCEKFSKKEEALTKLKGGAKFDEVAREFSKDKTRQGEFMKHPYAPPSGSPAGSTVRLHSPANRLCLAQVVLWAGRRAEASSRSSRKWHMTLSPVPPRIQNTARSKQARVITYSWSKGVNERIAHITATAALAL